MKILRFVLSLTLVISGFLIGFTPRAQAVTCSGNPYIITYVGANYSGSYSIWCSTKHVAGGDVWYTIGVSNVGQFWNDNIGSIKMYNWPMGSVIRYWQTAGYGGMHLTTTVDSSIEVIPNVYAYSWPPLIGYYDTITSFEGSGGN
jgi:hypothetical protein